MPDIPTADDFPIRIIKDLISKDLPIDEAKMDVDPSLLYDKPNNEPAEETPEVLYVKPANNQGYAKATPKPLAPPPKGKSVTRPCAPPQNATPIQGGDINVIVHPQCGFLSAEDWHARAQDIKAFAEVPTMSVRTYYNKELLVRAVNSAAALLPQAFLPEGPKSTAIGITVNLLYTLVVADRSRLQVHMGLEVAYTDGCVLEVHPYNIDPVDNSLWQDEYVPGLNPLQTDLSFVSDRPFTPVYLDVHNSYHSDVLQNGNTPIAVFI
jgi:hypothetical protein